MDRTGLSAGFRNVMFSELEEGLSEGGYLYGCISIAFPIPVFASIVSTFNVVIAVLGNGGGVATGVSMISKHFTYILVIHISLETPSESSVLLFHLSNPSDSSTIPRSSDSAPLFPSQPSAKITKRSQRVANAALL